MGANLYSMNLSGWIIGPQLIGLIFFIAGSVTRWFPPKNINPMYGYRTNSSMKNQETWDEANRFSARYMQWCGIILIIIGVISVIIFSNGYVPTNVLAWLKPLLTILPGILLAALTIIVTEKHLKKTFPVKDEIR
jgi:uncharacterized membrane protein